MSGILTFFVIFVSLLSAINKNTLNLIKFLLYGMAYNSPNLHGRLKNSSNIISDVDFIYCNSK